MHAIRTQRAIERPENFLFLSVIIAAMVNAGYPITIEAKNKKFTI